ncbi:DUF4349 domain-containing protein [Candidatus Uhrbacteria bacterium]|nr:DUF4349 domain-containing protein [Candidatus Uhrbacteria bacterium]
MSIQKSLPWITRVLAIVGVVALVWSVAQYFTGVRPIYTTSSPEFYEQAVTDSSTSFVGDYGEKAIMPGGELLRDDALAAEIDQKIIKTGDLSLIVLDVEESSAAVKSLAEEKGGYVQSSSVSEHEDGTLSGYVIIRVPADQFDSSVEALKSEALVVEEEFVGTQDVTEQYIDLSARLKNAQAQEVRYREILGSATTVEEILQIENALTTVRGNIESLTGQIQYLDSQTDFSTITVNLDEEPVIKVGGKVFRPGTTVKQAAQAVVSLAQWLVEAIIWIVIVGVGIGVPLAFIVWIIWKGVARLRKK